MRILVVQNLKNVIQMLLIGANPIVNFRTE